MSWDPSNMTYGEMERAAQAADLCGRCLHREVCPLPAELAERRWHLSVATCAHFQPLDDSCALCGRLPGEHDCRADPGTTTEPGPDDAEQGETVWRLRFGLAWVEVVAAQARQRLQRHEDLRRTHPDTPGYSEAVDLARVEERLIGRELAAARTALARAEESEP